MCRTDLTNRTGFGTGASFDLYNAVLYGNPGISENKATFLCNLPHTVDLENFTAARRSSQRVHGQSLVFSVWG